MFRKYFTITLVVLSLCFYMSLCYGDVPKPIQDAEKKLGNLERATDGHKETYNKIHGDIEDLIASWSEAESKVKNRNTAIAFTVGAAAIATAVAVVTEGTYAPAAWLSYMALHKAITETSA